jgi:phage-related protein
MGNLNMSAVLNFGGNFLKGMQDAQNQTSAFQSRIQNFANTAKLAFGATGVLAAGYLNSALNSAAKAQDSTVQLQRLVENQGVSWSQASGQVSNFTSGVMKMSEYSAGDAKTALINLTEKGVKFNDALKMQSTLTDLAAGTNTDLTSASNLLGQAYDGRYMQLERLGIVTKEQVKAGISFAQVQDAINKRFGGASKDQLSTYDGTMKQVVNTLNSFKTSIGQFILPYMQKFASFLDKMAQKLNNLSPSTKKFIAGALAMAAGLGTLIGGTTVLKKLFSFLPFDIEGIGKSLQGIAAPAALFIALITAICYAYLNNLGGLKDAVNKFIKTVLPDVKSAISQVTGFLNNHKKDVSKIMNDIGKFFANVVNWVTAHYPQIKSVVEKVFSGVASVFTKFVIPIFSFIVSHGTIVESVLGGILGGFLAFKVITGIITAITNVIKIWTIAQGLLNLVMDANPIGLVCVAIGILIAIGIALYKNWDTIKQKAGQLWTAIKAAFAPIANFAKDAFKWGSDMIDGLINGIKSKIGAIGNAVKGVGSTIASFLHFSCPDVGPLATYESWMPDFMQGMAKGIKVNTHLVTEPIKKVALGIKTNMQGGINGDSSSTPQAKTKGKGNIIVNIPKLADTLTVRNDSDIDKIAYALTKKLQKVANGMA